MQCEIELAKAVLEFEQHTCVVMKAYETHTSKQRGIAPLMHWLQTGIDMKGAIAADKVVGKAAAYLYVLLGIDALYAAVISKPALDVLENYQITVQYDQLVPAIRNRTDTGFCPMESAVLEIHTAEDAYPVLKQKLDELRQLQAMGNQ